MRTPIDLWIVWFLVFYALSAAHTRVFYPTFSDSFKLAAVLVFFWGTLCFCRDRESLKRFVTALILFGAVLSGVGLLQYLGAVPKEWWHEPKFLSSVYVNHNHFAGLLELLFPVSVGLAVAERDLAKKSLFIFFCVLSGVAFVFTLSRGGYISLTSGFFVMMFILWNRGILKNKRWLILAAVVLAAVGCVLLFGTAPLEQRLETFDEIVEIKETSFLERLQMWRTTLQIISREFLLGTGPGTFGAVFLHYRPEGFTDRPVYAHSDALQLLSDCGVLVFAVLAGLVFTLFWRGIRGIYAEESRLKLCLGAGSLGGLTAFLIHSLFDFNFHIPANWAFAAIVSALLISLQDTRPYVSSWKSKAAVGLKVGLLVLSLAGAVFFGLSDFYASRASSFAGWGRLDEAIAAYDKSLRINPLDPEVRFRRALTLIKKRLFGLASEDLKKAATLNPYEPYYDYNRLRLEFSTGALRGETLQTALVAVIAKDPNDAKLRYLIGRDLLLFNKPKESGQEALAVENLKRSVQLNPRYSQTVYGILWNYYNAIGPLRAFHDAVPQGIVGLLKFLQASDLWTYHRPFFLQSLGLDPEWKYRTSSSIRWDRVNVQNFMLSDFTSIDGRQVYKKDFFYRNGEITKEIETGAGIFRVVLHVKGSSVKGAYPYLLVNLDGKTVDSIYVDSPFEATFFSVIQAPPGKHVLSFRYVNDTMEPKTKKDRNLWIRWIQIQIPETG